MMDALASSPATRAAGLALVQFLWQGTLIGAATWLSLRMLSRASARSRYAAACLGLAVMAAAPVVTTLSTLESAAIVVPAPGVVHGQFTAGARAPIAGLDNSRPSRLSETWFQTASRAHLWIEARVPWIVTWWAAGVLWFALRLTIGGLRLRSIRRSATAVSGTAVSTAQAIARRLGVRKQVRLLASPRVVVPAVAGWIAPVILLPAAVLAGMPAAQLEAILAHELAHVRRGDFLINLLQCAAEVLLFFHPAVWWVSWQIRLERELCADDVAVAVSADRVTYAQALAALESFRADPRLAIGAGGDLLTRVRRLVDPDAAPPRLSGGTVMTLAIVILLLASVSVPARSASQEREAQPIAVPTAPATVAAEKSPVLTPRPSRARAEVPKTQVVEAQAQRGHLTGVVQDPLGGVLPGVTVVLTPVAAGGRGRAAAIPPRQTYTSANGTFVFDDLYPIQYDLTATLIGFRENRSRVTIRPDTRIYPAIRLELGSVSAEVTISSNATPRDPRGAAQGPAADYFDLAKLYYQQGRLAEAEEMTARALQILRSQTQATTLRAEPAAPKGPIRVGGEIREPRKTQDVKPIYPAEAAAAGTQGTVLIEATIGRDGSVANARVLKSVAGLDDAALSAVRQWTYTPTLLNGVPVEVLMTVTVRFVR
jgi:TonB family protein